VVFTPSQPRIWPAFAIRAGDRTGPSRSCLVGDELPFEANWTEGAAPCAERARDFIGPSTVPRSEPSAVAELVRLRDGHLRYEGENDGAVVRRDGPSPSTAACVDAEEAASLSMVFAPRVSTSTGASKRPGSRVRVDCSADLGSAATLRSPGDEVFSPPSAVRGSPFRLAPPIIRARHRRRMHIPQRW